MTSSSLPAAHRGRRSLLTLGRTSFLPCDAEELQEWSQLAHKCKPHLQQACGYGGGAAALLDETLSDSPRGLVCVAIQDSEVVSASSSFLANFPLVFSTDRRLRPGLNKSSFEVPGLGVMPVELDKCLNGEVCAQIYGLSTDVMEAKEHGYVTGPQPVVALSVCHDTSGTARWNLIYAFPVLAVPCVVLVLTLLGPVPNLILEVQRAREPGCGPVSQDLLDEIRFQLGPWRPVAQGLPAVVKVAEALCERMWHALQPENACIGSLFVPQLGRASRSSVAILSRWESAFHQALKGDLALLNPEDVQYELSSRSQYRAYFVADPMDLDCPLVFTSPGLEELTGRHRSSLLGRNFRFLLHMDEARNHAFNGPQLASIWKFVTEKITGETLSLLLCQRADGSTFWALLNLRHFWIEDPDGRSVTSGDQAYSHYMFGYVTPLLLQQDVLDDHLLEFSEKSISLLEQLRSHFAERRLALAAAASAVASNATRRSMLGTSARPLSPLALADKVIPDWLLAAGGVCASCWAGHNYVPRVGRVAVKEFEGRWSSLMKKSLPNISRLMKVPQDVLQKTQNNSEGGLIIAVCDPGCIDCPVVFLSQAFESSTGCRSGPFLARNLRFLLPRTGKVNVAINGDEQKQIDGFCSKPLQGEYKVFFVLTEDGSGSNHWKVLLMLHCEATSERDASSMKPYVIAVLHPVATLMPSVFWSRQVSELQVDDMGGTLDCWSQEVQQLREQIGNYSKARLKTIHNASDRLVNEAALMAEKRLAAFIRAQAGEDYSGDNFVPRIGLRNERSFNSDTSRALRRALFEESPASYEARALLDNNVPWCADGKSEALAMCVLDSSGEDCPVVHLTAAFEEMTGYSREYALGRNMRFLLPKSGSTSQLLNGAELPSLEHFCRPHGPPRLLTLMTHESRDGRPFWNLLWLRRAEVRDHVFFLVVMTKFGEAQEQTSKLAELLALDNLAVSEISRLRQILARLSGSIQIDSLKAIKQKFFGEWLDGFPAVFELPKIPCPSLPMSLSLVGLELDYETLQGHLLVQALQAGIRHFHIAFTNSVDRQDPVQNELKRRLATLRLAEALHIVRNQGLHYLRDATVFTLRTPPQFLEAFGEVKKALSVHGYRVTAWMLDARGVDTATVASTWKTMARIKMDGEVEFLGLHMAGLQALRVAQTVCGSAPVALYSGDFYPGKRLDDMEFKVVTELRRRQIQMLSTAVFGPRDCWLQREESQAAAKRLLMDATALALKWAEHMGYLSVVSAPALERLLRAASDAAQAEPKSPMSYLNVHRHFVKYYRGLADAKAFVQALEFEPVTVAPPGSRNVAERGPLSPRLLGTLKRQSHSLPPAEGVGLEGPRPKSADFALGTSPRTPDPGKTVLAGFDHLEAMSRSPRPLPSHEPRALDWSVETSLHVQFQRRRPRVTARAFFEASERPGLSRLLDTGDFDFQKGSIANSTARSNKSQRPRMPRNDADDSGLCGAMQPFRPHAKLLWSQARQRGLRPRTALTLESTGLQI